MKTLRNIGIATLFIVVLGLAGHADRTNEIVNSLNPHVYELIKGLGHDTDSEIAKEYMAHKEYYDTLSDKNLW